MITKSSLCYWRSAVLGAERKMKDFHFSPPPPPQNRRPPATQAKLKVKRQTALLAGKRA